MTKSNYENAIAETIAVEKHREEYNQLVKTDEKHIALTKGFFTKNVTKKIKSEVAKIKNPKKIHPLFHNIWFRMHPEKVFGELTITTAYMILIKPTKFTDFNKIQQKRKI